MKGLRELFRNNKNAFFFFLVALIFLNVLFRVYDYRNEIFKKFDAKYWENRYFHSQWVIPIDCKGKNLSLLDRNWCQTHKPQQQILLGDDGLYIYSGYKYATNLDPSLLNAEVPPLGKYIIGFFEIITGYIGMVSLFFAVFSLFLFYFFNKLIFKSQIISIIPVTLFSFEKIFYEQIKAPFLDTIFLSFLFLTLIFTLKKRYVLSAFSAGLFIATKSPFIVVVLYLALASFLVIKKDFKIKYILTMLATTFFTYAFSDKIHTAKLYIKGIRRSK